MVRGQERLTAIVEVLVNVVVGLLVLVVLAKVVGVFTEAAVRVGILVGVWQL